MERPDIVPEDEDMEEDEEGEPLAPEPEEDDGLYWDERVQKWAA